MTIAEPSNSAVISFFATAPKSMPATKVFYLTRTVDRGSSTWIIDNELELRWHEVVNLLRSYGAVDVVMLVGLLMHFIPVA
jgi:hypothetical protein